MLGTLREHSRSVIIYVLFGIIIVVFVFTFNVASPDAGCAGSTSQAKLVLITAGRQALDISDLSMGMALSLDPPPPSAPLDQRTFQQELLYRTTRFARLGGSERYRRYGPDPLKVSPIKTRKVADDLIETFIVSEEAMKYGLRASDEDVRSRIVAMFTDSDGKFQKSHYENYVRYALRTSIAKFEDFVRREVLRERMIDLITASVYVPKSEAVIAAKLRNAGREYEYIEIDEEALAQALQLSEGEIEAFLGTHADEVARYYEEHKSDFAIEPTYDFHLAKFSAASRRIMALISDPEARKGHEESWEDAKKRAQGALERLKGLEGEALISAFEAMARDSSDHLPTKEKGGRFDKPLEERDVLLIDPAVATALRNLKPLEVSDLVQGDDGYYILLLTDRTAGRERPLEEASKDVAKLLASRNKAREQLESISAAVLSKAKAQPTRSLKEVAEESNKDFAPFSPLRYGTTGKVPIMPESFAQIAEYSPTSVPGIGDSPDLIALKDLTPENPVADKVFDVGGSKYVIRLVGDFTPEKEPEASEIEAVHAELLQTKRVLWYRGWYDELKARYAREGLLIEHEPLLKMIQEELKTLEEGRKRQAKTNPNS